MWNPISIDCGVSLAAVALFSLCAPHDRLQTSAASIRPWQVWRCLCDSVIWGAHKKNKETAAPEAPRTLRQVSRARALVVWPSLARQIVLGEREPQEHAQHVCGAPMLLLG